eukprot:5352352-Pleurochrysis_carterae.AAC.1
MTLCQCRSLTRAPKCCASRSAASADRQSRASAPREQKAGESSEGERSCGKSTKRSAARRCSFIWRTRLRKCSWSSSCSQ